MDGETLGDRRVREAEVACAELGVARVEWLPYDDSGMAGTNTTTNPRAFSNADPARVAAEIAALLHDEVLGGVVGYDANGTYGHPDHIQVHLVVHALGALLPAAWVLDATYSREYLASLPDADGTLDPAFAASEADLTHFVQGEELFRAKVAATGNHLSQVPDDWDPDNPDLDSFRARFGTEWFIATAPKSAGFEFARLFAPKADWPGPPTG